MTNRPLTRFFYSYNHGEQQERVMDQRREINITKQTSWE